MWPRLSVNTEVWKDFCNFMCVWRRQVEGQMRDKCRRNEVVQTARQTGTRTEEGGEMCQNRGRLRHFLSCGLIYGYWERKSFTRIHTSSPALHSPEHILGKQTGTKNTFLSQLDHCGFQRRRIKALKLMCILLWLIHIPITITDLTSLWNLLWKHIVFTVKGVAHAKYFAHPL